MKALRKVLIVDDDGAIRSSLNRTLRIVGHEVWEARDGREAIALLNRQSVDVVVTDILMPNKDGLQTIQEIRIRWPNLKIIAMSGGGFIGAPLYLDLSLKMGAARLLEKPFSGRELLTAMEAVL